MVKGKEGGIVKKSVYLLILAMIMMSANCAAANTAVPDEVELRWRVPRNSPVGYKTFTNSVPQGNLDFDQIKKASSLPDSIRKKLKNLDLPDESSAISIFKKDKQGALNFKMITTKVDTSNLPQVADQEQLEEFVKSMEGTVQLRGQIDDTGELLTFYLEQKQKNLIAMMCELPKGKVSVGDTWPLNINLISLSHGFLADDSKRTNNVELTSIEKIGNDIIASIEYLVTESVAGKFVVPNSNEETKISMSFIFTATARFNVSKGRWEEYRGLMEYRGSGLSAGESSQLMVMEPISKIPKKYLVLE